MCPGAVPHEARIDILLDAPPRTEAQWLRIVTTEIDHVSQGYNTVKFLKSAIFLETSEKNIKKTLHVRNQSCYQQLFENVAILAFCCY